MITFDIETISCQNPDVISELSNSIRPPGNIKKEESIEKWMDENKDREIEKLIAKTSLSGMYGSVACIAWAHNDNKILATDASETNESNVIKDFYNFVDFCGDASGIFCGHNIHGFDLLFLKHRSMILGIKPPKTLLKAMQSRPWDGCIADTMLMWSQDKDKRISLDKLCKILGIKGKSDMDGSMVYKIWQDNPGKVVDYCKDDVKMVREVYKKLTFSGA